MSEILASRFDVVVIGSGFGGSVIAARLAEAGRTVCVLERGRRYPPGSFPRTQHGMSQNFWDPSSCRLGLFNVWSFKGIEAVVASGLGGGSLIYANVFLRKPREWFVENHNGLNEPWPITYDDLEEHYERVEKRMGVQQYPFQHEPYSGTKKTAALEEAAKRLDLHWELPNLAITFANKGKKPAIGEVIEEGDNIHGRTRLTCVLCGECDIGCNTGSKNTLDYTYLTSASKAGADIRHLAEARAIAPRSEGGYRISYVQHEAGNYWKKVGREPVEITADRLVLSAGSLGSTYLLLKNQRSFPDLSQRLGERFCGNGDLLAFATACRTPTPPAAVTRDLDPAFGPVITSTLRVPDELDGGTGRGFYIQDAGIPPFATWLLEGSRLSEVARRFVRGVWRRVRRVLRRDPRSDISTELAAVLGNCDFSRGWLPLLGMGRDVPDGRFSLSRTKDGEPHLACSWTMHSSREFFERVRSTMASIAQTLGGRFVANPTFRLSRVVTVHPLGGCPMGSTPKEGVVSPYGEVFGYPGFFIADGSVLPGPVGPNPALTIAAVADRTADYMLRAWR